jgi:hypothetical protein
VAEILLDSFEAEELYIYMFVSVCVRIYGEMYAGIFVSGISIDAMILFAPSREL